ncbi:uncharacterized protein METZ01_LOCUS125560 [marine metagenome]|jgi:hypothetical protein|uniref:Uncharacterized protein n=1 Tax=marine metagenome TaxID=408172 RepID=A0A381Y6I4_9ZZZZ
MSDGRLYGPKGIAGWDILVITEFKAMEKENKVF